MAEVWETKEKSSRHRWTTYPNQLPRPPWWMEYSRCKEARTQLSITWIFVSPVQMLSCISLSRSCIPCLILSKTPLWRCISHRWGISSRCRWLTWYSLHQSWCSNLTWLRLILQWWETKQRKVIHAYSCWLYFSLLFWSSLCFSSAACVPDSWPTLGTISQSISTD